MKIKLIKITFAMWMERKSFYGFKLAKNRSVLSSGSTVTDYTPWQGDGNTGISAFQNFVLCYFFFFKERPTVICFLYPKEIWRGFSILHKKV